VAAIGAVGPVGEGERVQALDVLRGFALCGILLMNITVMGSSFLTFRPLGPIDWSNPDWTVWAIGELFVEGTQRGLFGMLFGAGVLIMTARAMAPDGPVAVADAYYRRSLLLMALGVVHFSLLLWPGEILFTYGLMAIFLFPLRRLGPKVLTAIALLAMAVNLTMGSLYLQGEAAAYRDGAAAEAKAERGAALTTAEKEKLEARREVIEGLAPSAEKLAEEAKARRGGYGELVAWSLSQWAKFVGGFGPFIALDSLAAMTLGMALFKWDVITGRRSLAFYLGMTTAAYVMGLSINAWEVWTAVTTNFSPLAWPSQATYDVGRILTTLGHVGLVMALVKADALGFVGRALANLGRLALTNYIGQTVITGVLFYGLGLWGRLSWLELWGVCAAVWVLQAILSGWWLKVFRMGPLEWLLRAAAYGRPAPLLRGTAAASEPATA